MPKKPSKQPGKIREMFGSIAGRYDLLNRVLSLSIDRYWRRQLVSYVDGGPVLDVACGTGDVMTRLVQVVNSNVIGLDFSNPMLRHSENKLESPRVSLLQGDALKLPIQDDTMRHITCAFGVRNFSRRLESFEEFYRVLSTNGRVIILEFFPPDERWYLKPYHFYLQTILPKIGQWVSGSDDAYNYLKNSVEAFASRQDVKNELKKSGFNEIKLVDLSFGIATLIIADKE